VRAKLARVIGEPGAARLVVGRFQRVEIRREGRLRVHDEILVPGQPDDQVRAQPAVVRVDARLLVEVAVVEHARHLDHAPQLHLAPAPPDVRLAQRLDEVRRLAAELRLRLGERAHLLAELGIRADPRLLDLLHLQVELLERLAHRLHQLVDRLLALLQLALGRLLMLRERLLRQVDERLIVALQRFRRERAEGLREVLAGALDLGELPRRRLALHPQCGGQALGPAVQLGDRGARLVEPRGFGRELRARLAELPLGGPGTIGELGARDLEPQRRLL
jgi:hypothetical protein